MKLNEARFIDKTRILGDLGTVTDDFYAIIYDRLFELLFESKAYSLDKLQSQKEQLTKEVQILTSEIELLKAHKQIAALKDNVE